MFAKEAVQAIYMKENELQISGSWLPPIGILLRGLAPDLAFLGLRINGKSQMKALDEGRKDS